MTSSARRAGGGAASGRSAAGTGDRSPTQEQKAEEAQDATRSSPATRRRGSPRRPASRSPEILALNPTWTRRRSPRRELKLQVTAPAAGPRCCAAALAARRRAAAPRAAAPPPAGHGAERDRDRGVHGRGRLRRQPTAGAPIALDHEADDGAAHARARPSSAPTSRPPLPPVASESKIGLLPGERLTVADLLRGLLVSRPTTPR